MSLSRIEVICICFTFLLASAQCEIVINEMQAAPNGQLVEWTSLGTSHTGSLPVWQAADFDAGGWKTGRAPLGSGYGAQLGTDVTAEMTGRTPTIYLRRTVSLTAEQAALAEDLLVHVRYDDGFVLWINGREVTRANLGPVGQHVYHHQVTYRAGIAQSPPPVAAVMDFSPGPVRDWLRPGENIIAAVVSNRNLGSETTASYNNACLLDVALSYVPDRVESLLTGVDFAESNGATRTVRQTSTGPLPTQTGTPPPGSWLALAADPMIPPVNAGVSVKAEAVTEIGGIAPGAMRWEVSQTASGVQTAEFRGGPVPLGPRFAGAVTAEDLERLTFSLRTRVSATAGSGAAHFGFRLEAPDGTALTGFPDISDAGSADAAPKEYANFLGGYRALKVNADGTSSVSSTGLLRGSPALSAGPSVRGGVFRVTEDKTANAGYGDATGALKCEMTTAPAVPDEVRFTYAGLSAPGLAAGKISADDLVNTGLNVAFKAPAGRRVRLFLEPDSPQATVADQLNFGNFTGNGAWQVVELPLAGAADAEAVRARINALNVSNFRLGAGFSADLPVGQSVWLDHSGIVTLWRNFQAHAADSGAGAKTAFLTALNNAPDKSVTAVFSKKSNPVSPAVHSLTVDDVRLTYRESGGVAEQVVVEGAEGWQYFVGRCEPSGGLSDPASFKQADYKGDWDDWLELHNDGAETVDLSGWHLSDDPADFRKWALPAGTMLPPDGFLVIIADGKPAPAGAKYPHANFKLGSDGGSLLLSDAGGAVVSGFSSYPKQDGFHTWGLSGQGTYGYFGISTPGAANRGEFLPGRCDKPDFSVEPGFYNAPVTLAMTSDTVGCEIRYTMDGADPVETSALYTGSLTLTNAGNGRGRCIRARSFKAGTHPSSIRTGTWLISQDARLRASAAICLSGDEARTFFKPYGVTAIEGGSRPNALWQADTITDYNNALGDVNNPLLTGQAWERPATFELLPGDGIRGFNEDIGLRVSGSPFSRPRYELDNIATLPWSYTNLFEKPSFNLWWRGEYGNRELEYPLFGESYPVEKFSHLRLRGGHNDMPNPYVKDEYVRRLFIAMGRQGSRGTFNPLFVNGKFAGVYNLCERVRTPFMREHFGGGDDWDVIQRSEIADGNMTAFQDLLSRVDRHSSQPTAANYAAVEQVVDVEAFIDYLLLQTWAGTGDWPHNNWIASRERAPGGKWRWFPWDAEGAFGGFSKTLGYNIISQDLLVNPYAATREICRVYSSLEKSAEFRLKFADAINRHLCNGGALTDARLTALKDQVVGEYRPLLAYILSATVNESFFTSWVSNSATDKRDVLFRSAVLTISGNTADYGYQLPGQNLWPALEGHGSWQAPLPPLFNREGGAVGDGFQLTISHTATSADRTVDNPYRAASDQAPADRVIYFTTDGTDPRLAGGALSAAAQVYNGPVTLPGGPGKVKSRIRNTANSEWSPLTEATFQPPAVAPTAQNLVVAEFMYHPPDATSQDTGFTDQDDFEFVRLLNTGAGPLDLKQLRFTAGIDFNFSDGALSMLNPGESVLAVSNLEAFRARYGDAVTARVAGEYSGNLSNSGERVRLEDTSGVVLVEFSYNDSSPWPEAADGKGPSLVLREPLSRPDASMPESWTASAVPGGLGTMAAPLSYARWRDFLWAAGSGHSGAQDDADWDGFPNLLEYALGSDPLTASVPEFHPGFVEESGGLYLSITCRKLAGAGDVDLVVEAGDGVIWQSGPAVVLPVGDAVPQADGSLLQKWRDAVPAGQAQRRLLRVRVTQR